MAEQRFDSLDAALAAVRSAGHVTEERLSRENLVRQLHNLSQSIPGGHLVMITWTVEDGYPVHAAGYTQWTVRPVHPGYGCDGTTDDNVHLMGMHICQSLGIDYAEAYASAYDDTPLEEAREMFASILADPSIRQTTLMPALPPTKETLILLLSDLYQLNNRSFTDVLCQRFASKGLEVDDFCLREDTVKRAYMASLKQETAA